MRLQIDISDVAIEENEEMHQLHLWGVQTSLWKNNCLVCGKDTDASRIRCRCGEGTFCDKECQHDPRALPLRQCAFIKRTPLRDRPSSSHRRIVILQSEQPWLNLVWAEVKDSHLIIDNPSFDGFYGGSRTGSFWLDLAVINPAVENELFQKIGHGVAMGFSATMMDSNTVVETKWRNRAAGGSSMPGYNAQWPGPLVFFCYGYDLSDYIKVSPTQSDDVERGAEGDMSTLDIWKELDKMRYRGVFGKPETVKKQVKGKGKGAAGKSATPSPEMVWKWKVKEHGTSMRILDLTHKDLNIIFDYITLSQLNPTPFLPKVWNTTKHTPAIHVQDLNHPGYGLKALWEQVSPQAQLGADSQPNKALTVYSPRGGGENISIRYVILPLSFPIQPMLAAFTVGLPWMVHYSMDINPPFRDAIPRATSWPTMELMWTVGLSAVRQPPILGLHIPTFSCDSAAIVDSEATVLHPHHVRALYKYLRHTDPREWSRRGPQGFESYWAVYAKVEVGRDKVGDVYALPKGARKITPVVEGDEIARVMAHLTLEGLGKEDLERVEEIAKIKGDLLNVVYHYRKASPGREFVEK